MTVDVPSGALWWHRSVCPWLVRSGDALARHRLTTMNMARTRLVCSLPWARLDKLTSPTLLLPPRRLSGWLIHDNPVGLIRQDHAKFGLIIGPERRAIGRDRLHVSGVSPRWASSMIGLRPSLRSDGVLSHGEELMKFR